MKEPLQLWERGEQRIDIKKEKQTVLGIQKPAWHSQLGHHSPLSPNKLTEHQSQTRSSKAIIK